MEPADSESFTVTSPAQAKALAHPARHRILHAIGESDATISQLAHRLHTNKGNVAHHLRVLEAAGLARKSRSRTVRGGTEQYWAGAAQIFVLPAGDGEAARAVLDVVGEDVTADPEALLHHRVIRLTHPQVLALRRHLDRVVTGLKPGDARSPDYNVVVGVARRRC